MTYRRWTKKSDLREWSNGKNNKSVDADGLRSYPWIACGEHWERTKLQTDIVIESMSVIEKYESSECGGRYYFRPPYYGPEIAQAIIFRCLQRWPELYART